MKSPAVDAYIAAVPPVHGGARLERAVAKYAGPKGNLKFPHDQRSPSSLIALIARIFRHKVKLDNQTVRKKSRK